MTKFKTAFKEIDGAKDFLDKVKKPLEEINADIQELEDKKEELEGKLNSGNSFKLKELEKNKEVHNELNLVKQMLSKAIEERNRIQEHNDEVVFDEATRIIKKHRAKVKTAYPELNKEMITKIYEIRLIYKELLKYAVLESQQIKDFLNDLAPFIPEELTPKERHHLGNTTPKYELNKEATTKGLIQVFTEESYYIKGLLPKGTPDVNIKEPYHADHSAWNNAFGVDIDEIKEAVKGRNVPEV